MTQVFKIAGEFPIIAVVKREYNKETNSILLEYPLYLNMSMMGNNINLGFLPMFPIAKNKRELLESFELNMSFVVYHYEPEEEVIKAYSSQIANIKAAFSGILIPNQKEMNALNNKGLKLVQ